MGGSDESENIIELSIEEHALAHKKLYEEFGKNEDFIAWKMLSGKSEEAEDKRIELAKNGFKKFLVSEKAKKWKQKIKSSMTGKKMSETHRKNIGKALKNSYKNKNRRNFLKEVDRSFFVDNYHKFNFSKSLSLGRKKSKKWKDSVTSEEYKLKKCLADPRSYKIIHEGKEYPSIRNAAKCLGISYSKMRRIVLK